MEQTFDDLEIEWMKRVMERVRQNVAPFDLESFNSGVAGSFPSLGSREGVRLGLEATRGSLQVHFHARRGGDRGIVEIRQCHPVWMQGDVPLRIVSERLSGLVVRLYEWLDIVLEGDSEEATSTLHDVSDVRVASQPREGDEGCVVIPARIYTDWMGRPEKRGWLNYNARIDFRVDRGMVG